MSNIGSIFSETSNRTYVPLKIVTSRRCNSIRGGLTYCMKSPSMNQHLEIFVLANIGSLRKSQPGCVSFAGKNLGSTTTENTSADIWRRSLLQSSGSLMRTGISTRIPPVLSMARSKHTFSENLALGTPLTICSACKSNAKDHLTNRPRGRRFLINLRSKSCSLPGSREVSAEGRSFTIRIREGKSHIGHREMKTIRERICVLGLMETETPRTKDQRTQPTFSML